MTTSSELTKSTTAGETQTRTISLRRSNYAPSRGHTCVHSTARGLPSSVHSSSGLQSPHSCPRSRRRSALPDSRHGRPTFAPSPALSLCVSCSDQCVISTGHVSSWDLDSWEPPSHVRALDSLHPPPRSPPFLHRSWRIHFRHVPILEYVHVHQRDCWNCQCPRRRLGQPRRWSYSDCYGIRSFPSFQDRNEPRGRMAYRSHRASRRRIRNWIHHPQNLR